MYQLIMDSPDSSLHIVWSLLSNTQKSYKGINTYSFNLPVKGTTEQKKFPDQSLAMSVSIFWVLDISIQGPQEWASNLWPFAKIEPDLHLHYDEQTKKTTPTVQANCFVPHHLQVLQQVNCQAINILHVMDLPPLLKQPLKWHLHHSHLTIYMINHH